MTKFEPSAHAYLLSKLDNHNRQNAEYWNKRIEDIEETT